MENRPGGGCLIYTVVFGTIKYSGVLSFPVDDYDKLAPPQAGSQRKVVGLRLPPDGFYCPVLRKLYLLHLSSNSQCPA